MFISKCPTGLGGKILRSFSHITTEYLLILQDNLKILKLMIFHILFLTSYKHGCWFPLEKVNIFNRWKSQLNNFQSVIFTKIDLKDSKGLILSWYVLYNFPLPLYTLINEQHDSRLWRIVLLTIKYHITSSFGLFLILAIWNGRILATCLLLKYRANTTVSFQGNFFLQSCQMP